MSETADQQPSSTNDNSSFSFKENVKPPRNLCNKSGVNSRSLCKRKSFGSKTCFVCGSKFHLIKDCDFYEKQLKSQNQPMWNNVANIPSFVPKAASVPADSRNRQTSVPAGSRNRPASVPTGSRNRPTSVPAGRPFSAGWKNNAARPMTRPTSHYFQHFSRPGYYNHMNMDEGRWGTAENPHKNRDLGIVDSGCSRSMTGNKEKLDDFVKIVGGTVTFGGGDGKITRKGTIRTSKLNFENVYYVEELQNFNLFSVSQICDTKNKVLFTDKEKATQDSYKAIYCLGAPILAPLQLLLQGLFGPTHQNALTTSTTPCVLTIKVKAIRCDNGIEFKNSKLIELCGSKGIRRDYSNARTLQQNGVAKRKNRTRCIEARQELCLLTLSCPTNVFGQNHVANISHLKPFGCLVTILNTSDHLGKFEGKADEGFIVGVKVPAGGYVVPTGKDMSYILVVRQNKKFNSCCRTILVQVVVSAAEIQLMINLVDIVLASAEERFLKIKQALKEELNQPKNIQELLLKLINDLQILNGIPLKTSKSIAATVSFSILEADLFAMDDNEESMITRRVLFFKMKLFLGIPSSNANHNLFYQTLETEDSLIMGNEELNTIPKKESNEFIKSSVEDLVSIPSKSEDTSGSDSECILPLNE
ncbi:putative ribonuclease H-like domain-containing protein [Tanacetum coccineum]|uniref:Ribonuclease H-like domain-containing protein n=1 Tax=Tanacetum coccineum TaxID=301880 RepID=A0ABQ5G4H1_9ASTR